MDHMLRRAQSYMGEMIQISGEGLGMIYVFSLMDGKTYDPDGCAYK